MGCTQYSITFAACDPSPVFAHPSTRTPARGVMKYTILVKLPWSSLVCTRFFLFMHRSREDFTEMTFTPKLSPLGRGTLNLQFLVSLPYRNYVANLVKIGSVVVNR